MSDLEDLQTFMDAGGVSPAATRLGIAHAIVSRSLLRPERQLGLQLFAHAVQACAEIGPGLGHAPP